MLSGRGGDARANAISRLATSSVGAEPAAWPLLWRKRRDHGSWPNSAGKGSRVGARAMYVGQMRCTRLPQPGASLWWVPLQGVDNQATAPTSLNPSQRYSRVAPLPSCSGRRTPL